MSNQSERPRHEGDSPPPCVETLIKHCATEWSSWNSHRKLIKGILCLLRNATLTRSVPRRPATTMGRDFCWNSCKLKLSRELPRRCQILLGHPVHTPCATCTARSPRPCQKLFVNIVICNLGREGPCTYAQAPQCVIKNNQASGSELGMLGCRNK